MTAEVEQCCLNVWTMGSCQDANGVLVEGCEDQPLREQGRHSGDNFGCAQAAATSRRNGRDMKNSRSGPIMQNTRYPWVVHAVVGDGL